MPTNQTSQFIPAGQNNISKEQHPDVDMCIQQHSNFRTFVAALV